MVFDFNKLLAILVVSFLLGTFALFGLRGSLQRTMLLGLLIGLLFYSGIGGADVSVPSSYIASYFIFFVAVIAGFRVARPVLFPASQAMGRLLPPAFVNIDKIRKWRYVIVAYILLSFFPLIWPEFKLQNLISLEVPDLGSLFLREFVREPDVLTRLFGYLHLLLTPFFYVALYRLRFQLWWVIALFALLIYVEYSVNAYIGRSSIMQYIGVFGLSMWWLRPEYRHKIYIFGVVALPLLLYGFYIYQVIRIGGVVGDISLLSAVLGVLEIELGFPKDVGVPIIESAKHVDLASYFTWILTLPIPKVLTGPIIGARINYEISEIVLGTPTGTDGWYVVLPGLVAESIYIYGRYFFWLHGFFVGALAMLMARIMERSPQMLFLQMNVVLLFAYVLNRAGIGAVLPLLVNQFLMFYILLLIVASRERRRRRRNF